MNNIDENFKFEANRSSLKISFERISFIFFVFFIITIIFTSKTIYLGFKKTEQIQTLKDKEKFREDAYEDKTMKNGKLVTVGYVAGFGSNTTTKKDGTVIKIKKGMKKAAKKATANKATAKKAASKKASKKSAAKK